MPIQVSCPKCRKALAVADDMAGRGVRCPQCETAFQAPGSTVGDQPPAPTAPAGSPASIGPYPIRRKLGEGAFGVVYLCHDDDLDRDVAVKVLRAAALGSEKHSQRFLREAKVVAKMLHGNIVPVRSDRISPPSNRRSRLGTGPTYWQPQDRSTCRWRSEARPDRSHY